MSPTEARLQVIHACAKALLARIDDLTGEQFRCGYDRPEREALRAAIAEYEAAKA